jgi:hypothetical protein
MVSNDGRVIPIYRVRTRTTASPSPVGSAERTRLVISGQGTNHHIEIIAEVGKDGMDRKWMDVAVSRLDAHRKVAERRRESQRHASSMVVLGENREVRMMLAINDYVEMLDDGGKRMIYRVKSLSEGDMEFQFHCDARDSEAVKAADARVRRGAEALRRRECRKVRVGLLGDVAYVT